MGLFWDIYKFFAFFAAEYLNDQKTHFLTMKPHNDLIIRAARGEKTERVPVWMMRQAGRILPEYRAVREKIGDFKTLVETPEFAAEVTIQPVDILGVDAAIIFSDILVIPEAMGLPYKMLESKGPWFEKTIKDEKDIDSLLIADENEFSYVPEAIFLSKRELSNRVPLIGFAGAPWTILAYMVEGTGSKTFSIAKKFLYTRPDLAHKLLDKITKSTINYLVSQIKAGADLIQIFDSWGGVLSPHQFRIFSLKYMEVICSSLKEKFPEIPIIVFAKGTSGSLMDISEIPCDVIGLDWNTEAAFARAVAPEKTLQGNMDPCLLYSDMDIIREETKKMLLEFGPHKYIANLGHGVYPDVEKEKAKCFIDTVKAFKFPENLKI